MNTVIRNGRIIDPANKRDEIADLLIVDGRIAALSQLSTLNSQPDEIDARNLIVCPGLIDLHVHLREPGFGWKETIESGACAAAAGGFTTVVCMPNTSPVADSPSTMTGTSATAVNHPRIRRGRATDRTCHILLLHLTAQQIDDYWQ